MTLPSFCRGGLLAILLTHLAIIPAHGTTLDTSPRKTTILLRKSPRLLAQDGWHSVALYAVVTGQLLRRFPVGEWIKAIDVTADEGLVLVGGGDGGVGVWNLETGERLWWKAPSQTGLTSVYDACFSHDGRSFVVCNEEDFALVYETRTGHRLARVGFKPQTTMFLSAALSTDGSQGVLVGPDGRLFTFDVSTGAMQDTGLTGARPVRYSVDGKSIACRSNDSGRSEQLRVVSLDTPVAYKDVGQFSYIGHIRPAEEGGFLVTAEVRQPGERASIVGARYSPGRDQVDVLWRLGRTLSLEERTDFDPQGMLGASTDFDLVTTLTELRTGNSLIVIDNGGKPMVGMAPSSPVAWLLSCGALTLAVVSLAVVGLVSVARRRRRSEPTR